MPTLEHYGPPCRARSIALLAVHRCAIKHLIADGSSRCRLSNLLLLRLRLHQLASNEAAWIEPFHEKIRAVGIRRCNRDYQIFVGNRAPRRNRLKCRVKTRPVALKIRTTLSSKFVHFSRYVLAGSTWPGIWTGALNLIIICGLVFSA